MDPLSAALGFAGTALGFLGGRKPKETKQKLNLKGLRTRAERAGFNPAFVLGATGGQGFGKTVSPGLSSLESLGGVLTGASQFFDAIDPVKQETEQLELDLLRTQLDAIKEQQTIGRSVGYALGSEGVPTSTAPKTAAQQQPAPAPDDWGTLGLPFGQPYDQDTAYEIESDAYLAGIRGQLGPWATELWNRNQGADQAHTWGTDYRTTSDFWSMDPRDWFRATDSLQLSPLEQAANDAAKRRFDPFKRDAYNVYGGM